MINTSGEGIKIQTIGLTDSMRSVVAAVASGTVHFTSVPDRNPNDFEVEQSEPMLLFSLPCFGVRQLSGELIRYSFGTEVDSMVRVTVATPHEVFELAEGMGAIVDFSDSTKVYSGYVRRTTPKLSSLWYVFIDTTHSLKVDFARAGIVLKREVR